MKEDDTLTRLAKAIDYPEEVPSGAAAFVFQVDGSEVTASAENGRIVLSRVIASAGDVDIARFAEYAAGRVLREEAVLAYDPSADAVILWQDLAETSDAALLRRFFEVFAASCDWWLARVESVKDASSIPEMTIRP